MPRKQSTLVKHCSQIICSNYESHSRLLRENNKKGVSHVLVREHMMLPMHSRQQSCMHEKNHEPTLSCSFISEVLRTLLNIGTKMTDAETDPKHTRDSKSHLLTPHGHYRASGKIIYCMCTILRLFQELGPMETRNTFVKIGWILIFFLFFLHALLLCWVFVLLSKGPCLVFSQRAFPFLGLQHLKQRTRKKKNVIAKAVQCA